jgi:hypothetical protein
MSRQTGDTDAQKARVQTRFDGVVIGVLVGYKDEQTPLVAFPGNPDENAVPARSTVTLGDEQIGKEVALLFEGGDPRRPILIGPIQYPVKTRDDAAVDASSAEIDGERIVLAAKKELVLKCGKASITLTKAGKVLIRGAYLLNRSSGVNRIKGGSVQIN